MNFEFMKKVDDTTGDFASAYRKCVTATECMQDNPEKSIIVFYKAMIQIIRCVYKTESLPLPKAHYGNNLVDADYMHHDSSFTKWLNDQSLIHKCNEIRDLRNRSAHNLQSKYEPTAEDAKRTGEKLEKILSAICNKISKVEFRNPRDFHQPCVILLDISGSMLGAEGTPVGSRPIDELNNAIEVFKNDMKSQRDVNACAEVCFITFNGTVEVIQPFKNADKFNIPQLEASGMTAMNEAIDKALEIIETQKELYNREDVDYYRPWIYLLSDGAPTDDNKEQATKKKLREAIEGKHVVFYPVKIGKWADVNRLKSYYPDSTEKRIVISAEKGHFKDLFQFFSNSIRESIKNGGNTDILKREFLKTITVDGITKENR